MLSATLGELGHSSSPTFKTQPRTYTICSPGSQAFGLRMKLYNQLF